MNPHKPSIDENRSSILYFRSKTSQNFCQITSPLLIVHANITTEISNQYLTEPKRKNFSYFILWLLFDFHEIEFIQKIMMINQHYLKKPQNLTNISWLCTKINFWCLIVCFCVFIYCFFVGKLKHFFCSEIKVALKFIKL